MDVNRPTPVEYYVGRGVWEVHYGHQTVTAFEQSLTVSGELSSCQLP